MASLQRTRRSSRTPRASRQSSMDMRNDKMMDPKSTPASPIAPPRQDAVLIPSNNSSSTSLASHLVTNNKSSPALESRPPSAYYSRDLLGSLAPREGGYAIAAQMGGGLGAVGSMVVDERRKSQMYDTIGPKVSSRAPMSKSSGMGRWSLDGGEVSLCQGKCSDRVALWLEIIFSIDPHHVDKLVGQPSLRRFTSH